MRDRSTWGDPAADSRLPQLPLAAALPGRSRETAVTITELNNSTKALLERKLAQFWVRGEVTDFKRHRSGHWYFCLRDKLSQISCVVWSGDQQRIPASPDDGMQVVALAHMTMHAARGALQLRLTHIEAQGDGLWRKAMEETVKRLRADGLLAPERKKKIPIFPRCLAVITSANGAALHDIVSVAQRRRPGIQIVVACAAVQGDTAPHELRRALSRVRRWKGVDVLIIGRGGGAREDLHAFNDESVARAIAACEMPVISAIGHEIDTTVCDLVADLRAATPSAAAERAVPAIADLQKTINARRERLVSALAHRSASAHADFKTTARDLKSAAARVVEKRKIRVAGVAAHLNALSPLATLSRGYAVARSPAGETLTRVSQFVNGDSFDLLLHDGEVGARVENVRERREPSGEN
ncbi:MAG: exodeoxyribonuclease VII large subunit [Gemmatimonadaceae bacterium]